MLKPLLLFFFFFKGKSFYNVYVFIYLIFGCAGAPLLHVSFAVASGGCSSLWCRGRCGGFSCCEQLGSAPKFQ